MAELLGAGVGMMATSATTLFSYNKDAYVFNNTLRQQRNHQLMNMRIQQVGLYREDLRDLFGLTIMKMDNYLVVNTLMLGFVITLLYDSNLPVGTPSWLFWLWILTIASSTAFLLLSIWMALHASITAQSFVVRLLTQWLRPPIPSDDEIVNAATSIKIFEEGGNFFRIPLSSRVASGLKGAFLNISGADTEPSEGPTLDKMESAVRNQGISGTAHHSDHHDKHDGRDHPLENYGRPAVTRIHMSLFRQLQDSWQGYDAYARVCMVLGTNQLLAALSHFSVAHFLLKNGQVFPAWGILITLVVSSYLHFRMALTLSQTENLTMVLLLVTGPLASGVGSTLEYFGWSYWADIAGTVAIIPHLLWLAFVQREAREDKGGLPTSFTTVSMSADVLLESELNKEMEMEAEVEELEAKFIEQEQEKERKEEKIRAAKERNDKGSPSSDQKESIEAKCLRLEKKLLDIFDSHQDFSALRKQEIRVFLKSKRDFEHLQKDLHFILGEIPQERLEELGWVKMKYKKPTASILSQASISALDMNKGSFSAPLSIPPTVRSPASRVLGDGASERGSVGNHRRSRGLGQSPHGSDISPGLDKAEVISLGSAASNSAPRRERREKMRDKMLKLQNLQLPQPPKGVKIKEQTVENKPVVDGNERGGDQEVNNELGEGMSVVQVNEGRPSHESDYYYMNVHSGEVRAEQPKVSRIRTATENEEKGFKPGDPGSREDLGFSRLAAHEGKKHFKEKTRTFEEFSEVLKKVSKEDLVDLPKSVKEFLDSVVELQKGRSPSPGKKGKRKKWDGSPKSWIAELPRLPSLGNDAVSHEVIRSAASRPWITFKVASSCLMTLWMVGLLCSLADTLGEDLGGQSRVVELVPGSASAGGRRLEEHGTDMDMRIDDNQLLSLLQDQLKGRLPDLDELDLLRRRRSIRAKWEDSFLAAAFENVQIEESREVFELPPFFVTSKLQSTIRKKEGSLVLRLANGIQSLCYVGDKEGTQWEQLPQPLPEVFPIPSEEGDGPVLTGWTTTAGELRRNGELVVDPASGKPFQNVQDVGVCGEWREEVEEKENVGGQPPLLRRHTEEESKTNLIFGSYSEMPIFVFIRGESEQFLEIWSEAEGIRKGLLRIGDLWAEGSSIETWQLGGRTTAVTCATATRDMSSGEDSLKLALFMSVLNGNGRSSVRQVSLLVTGEHVRVGRGRAVSTMEERVEI